MSEIYNRTLLWSGAASSSCTLSEPVTNFEYFQVTRTYPQNVGLFPSNITAARYRIDTPGAYQNAGYLANPLLFKLSNGAKTLQSVTFNFLSQAGSANAQTLGSGVNTTNNLKAFTYIYGINRVSGTPTTAIGIPYTGVGWRAYDETVLWSAAGYGYKNLALSEPASAFERIRIKIGDSSNGYTIREYTSPSGDNDWLTTHSYWGTADNVLMFDMSKYVWTSGTKMLSSNSASKVFHYDVTAQNPYTGTGATGNANWSTWNIVGIYGINRK